LPRAHRALTKGYNLIDSTRRSPSYEVRLAKYAQRGYQVLVPGLDRTRIDPTLFQKVPGPMMLIIVGNDELVLSAKENWILDMIVMT